MTIKEYNKKYTKKELIKIDKLSRKIIYHQNRVIKSYKEELKILKELIDIYKPYFKTRGITI